MGEGARPFHTNDAAGRDQRLKERLFHLQEARFTTASATVATIMPTARDAHSPAGRLNHSMVSSSNHRPLHR